MGDNKSEGDSQMYHPSECFNRSNTNANPFKKLVKKKSLFHFDVINNYHAFCRICQHHFYSSSEIDDINSFFQRHLNSVQHIYYRKVYPVNSSSPIFSWEQRLFSAHCTVCKQTNIEAFVIVSDDIYKIIRDHSNGPGHNERLELTISKPLSLTLPSNNLFCEINVVQQTDSGYICKLCRVKIDEKPFLDYHLNSLEHCKELCDMLNREFNVSLSDSINDIRAKKFLQMVKNVMKDKHCTLFSDMGPPKSWPPPGFRQEYEGKQFSNRSIKDLGFSPKEIENILSVRDGQRGDFTEGNTCLLCGETGLNMDDHMQSNGHQIRVKVFQRCCFLKSCVRENRLPEHADEIEKYYVYKSLLGKHYLDFSLNFRLKFNNFNSSTCGIDGTSSTGSVTTANASPEDNENDEAALEKRTDLSTSIINTEGKLNELVDEVVSYVEVSRRQMPEKEYRRDTPGVYDCEVVPESSQTVDVMNDNAIVPYETPDLSEVEQMTQSTDTRTEEESEEPVLDSSLTVVREKINELANSVICLISDEKGNTEVSAKQNEQKSASMDASQVSMSAVQESPEQILHDTDINIYVGSKLRAVRETIITHFKNSKRGSLLPAEYDQVAERIPVNRVFPIEKNGQAIDQAPDTLELTQSVANREEVSSDLMWEYSIEMDIEQKLNELEEALIICSSSAQREITMTISMCTEFAQKSISEAGGDVTAFTLEIIIPNISTAKGPGEEVAREEATEPIESSPTNQKIRQQLPYNAGMQEAREQDDPGKKSKEENKTVAKATAETSTKSQGMKTNHRRFDYRVEFLRKSLGCNFNMHMYICVVCMVNDPCISIDDHLGSEQHIANEGFVRLTQNVEIWYCEVCKKLIVGSPVMFRRHFNSLQHLQFAGKKAGNEKITLEINGDPDGRDELHCFLNSKTIKLLENYNRLTKFLNELAQSADAMKISSKENRMEIGICETLISIIRLIFPESYCHRFGSRASGLASQKSDLDVFVDIGMFYDGINGQDEITQTIIVHSVAYLLIASGKFDNVNCIWNCRVPIVSFVHKSSMISCDVSFKNGLGCENTSFIRYILKKDGRIKKLILFLKNWIVTNELCRGPYFSSYALTMLVFFYLQQGPKPIMPCVDAMRNCCATAKKYISGWDCSYCVKHFPRTKNSDTVPELILNFFDFCSKFDFANNVLSPLLGEAIPRARFRNAQDLPLPIKVNTTKIRLSNFSRETNPISIMDPFDLNHNLTKSFPETEEKRECEKEVRARILSMLEVLLQGDSGDCR